MTVLRIQGYSILSLQINFSFDVFKQTAITPFKTLILVHILSILVSNFPKAVHVQLSYK